MLHNLIQGLTSLGNPAAIGWLVVGAVVGLVFGIIPGLGGAVVLSMILVFVYDISLLGTLCLFLGVHAGSYYASSTSSILLNTPSHPESWAVTLDGYPMARKGGAGRALGLSAASTCIGGVIGFVIMIASLPVLNSLPSIFHPPEYLALVTFAMLLVGTLGAGSVLKALASAGLGLMCASIGSSIITGGLRYTFGQIDLIDGVSLVAIALGTLALPQMVLMFGTGSSVMHQDLAGNKLKESEAVRIDKNTRAQLLGGILEAVRHWWSNLVAGTVGTVVGAVPGVGGFTANFMSYGVRKQLSKNRDAYGTGIAEGVISAEGSNLAKEYGHMIPLLGLGIPGGVGGALFIGALAIKDVNTGYGFVDTYPVIPYQIAWILLITGIIGTGLGVLLGPQLARITFVPGPVIVPFVIAMSVIGPYLTDSTFTAVLQVLVSTIIGFILIRLRYPIATFILALILGKTFETNAYLTVRIYPGFSFVEHRPLADLMFALTIVVLGAKVVSTRRQSRQERSAVLAELSTADPSERQRLAHSIALRKDPHPLLGLIVTVALLFSSVWFIYYGFAKYDFTTRLMPVIGAFVVAVPALVMLPADIRHYIASRRRKKSDGGADEPVPTVPEPEILVPALVGKVIEGAHAEERYMTPGGSEGAVSAPAAVTKASDDLPEIRHDQWGRHGQYTREVVCIAWVAAMTAAAYLFGYYYSIPVFMLVYGLTATRRSFSSRRNQVIFSVVAAVAMYFIARELFDISHQEFTPLISF